MPHPPPAPSPWSRAASVVRTVLLLALAVLGWLMTFSLVDASNKTLGLTFGSPEAAQLVIGLALVIALPWRSRGATWITLASGIASTVLGLDPTVGLIASTTVVADLSSGRSLRRRDPITWTALAALVIGTSVAVHTDAVRAPRGASMLGILVFSGDKTANGHGSISGLTQYVALLMVLALPVVVGLAIGARRRRLAAEHAARQEGLARWQAEQARRQAEQARRAAQAQAAHRARDNEALLSRVELSEERERIAREVHDGLGHHLSLLAMQAGVLEASADESTAKAARALRQGAQAAMEELRSLLGVLRDPVSSQSQASRLDQLSSIVGSLVEVGTPLSSSIVLDRPAEASALLSRSVYRIVQECLTNASKHCPQQLIRLRVEGGPGRGVRIVCTNPLEPGSAAAGTGSGLRGMLRRAELCGGTFRAGPRAGSEFVVEVELPWRITP